MEALIKNKKILIVTECFYPEEFKINDIAISWKDKNYEVDVLTLVPSYPQGKIFKGYKNGIFQKSFYQGIKIYRVHAVTGYRDSTIKKIYKYISFMILGSIASIFIGKNYNYIFCFNTGPLTAMMPGVIIRKLYKRPLAIWTQDVWPDSVYAYGIKKTKLLSMALDKFVKFMYHNIDEIIVSGKNYESKLSPYVRKGSEFHYLPNWADDLNSSLAPAKLGNIQGIIHFTFAGNIGKVQNLDNIINAFSLLTGEYKKKYQFNIIGDGSNLEKLKELAGSNENIVFHGKKPRSEMASYYKASDFLIISLIDNPIFSVTVPAKTQTYIAAKKPILAIINGEVANIIKENNLGLCANPSEIKTIAKTLQHCIDMSNTERELFTSKNDYLLETIFNKEKTIEKLLEIILNIRPNENL